MGLSPGQTSVSFLWPLLEAHDHNTGRGLVPVIVLTPESPETHLELRQAFLGSGQARHGRDAVPPSGQQGCSVDRMAGRPVLEGMQHLHLSGIRTSRKAKEYNAVFFGASESSVHMAVAESLREPPPNGGWFLSSLFLKIF
uniref:Long intergenic non-protein coding RNA 2907 n=1 Tax=Pongo abelii TaxID=9601 RepID=H2PTX0_PONAB